MIDFAFKTGRKFFFEKKNLKKMSDFALKTGRKFFFEKKNLKKFFLPVFNAKSTFFLSQIVENTSNKNSYQGPKLHDEPQI